MKNEKLVKKIYELLVRYPTATPAAAEVISNIFLGQGIKEEEIVQLSIDGRSFVSVFFTSQKQAHWFHHQVLNAGLKKITVKLRSLESKDWQEKWKEDFRPFQLTRKVDVAPVWHKRSYRSPRRVIYIDTVLAFGTGLHETTRFVGRLIERTAGQFSSFLDVGTGTGILSILAYVYGAKIVWAVDIDKNCLAVAKTNLSANGFEFDTMKAVDVAEFKPGRRFDFVAANLISRDLIKLRRKLYALVAPGKYLAMSGISHENFKPLAKAFRQLPLKCLQVHKGRKWVAVLYQREK